MCNVRQIAIISPFSALGRKWCNFEFSLAKNESKEVLMVASPFRMIWEACEFVAMAILLDHHEFVSIGRLSKALLLYVYI